MEIEPFDVTESNILSNKKNGIIYVADFGNGEGKYISATAGFNDDMSIIISPKVEVRITFIENSNSIKGVKLSKLCNGKIESMHLSTMSFKGILYLLQIFSKLNLISLASRAIILDNSIIKDETELINLLNTIAVDPKGKEKIKEVVKNFRLFDCGDIDEIVDKRRAVNKFEEILNNKNEFGKLKISMSVGKDEEVWQKFFSENSWILGTEYIKVLDERILDPENITDFILQSYDGFIDIVELKLPCEILWTDALIPRSELTSAITQCMKYILQTERKINDLQYGEKIENIPIIKPRITLIYGRSNNWKKEEKEVYRVVNSSYYNISIVTYDHVLERAKRIMGMSQIEGVKNNAQRYN